MARRFSAALLIAVVGGFLTVPALVPAASADDMAGGFTPVSPARLLDTRNGTGAIKARIGAGKTVTVRVTGLGGVPASGVSAVALNVTVTQPSANGYVTAYPAGSSRPTASNLNFAKGATVSNLVLARVGSGGRVTLYNGATGTVDLIADVAGYHRDGSVSDAGGFTAVSPARLLDTRNGTGAPRAAVGAGKTVTIQVTGRGGIPASGVSAVALNVTVTQPTGNGYATVYPTGGSRPNASNLNFTKGATVSNLVIARVGTGGKVTLHNGAKGTIQLIADLAGHYRDGSVSTDGGFTPVSPARLLDTRNGTGAARAAVGAGKTVTLQVTGRGGVPSSGVSAVALNVTVTQPTGNGYATVYPAGMSKPGASNLNFTKGRTVSNLVIARVGSGGKVTLHNGAKGTIQLIADVAGHYRGPAVSGSTAAVSSLTAVGRSSASVALEWTNSGSPAAIVVRRAKGATPPATATSGDAGIAITGTPTTFLDSGLEPDTQYSYSVFAKSPSGVYSSAASADAETLGFGTVKGKVTVASNGAPLAGVKVYLNRTSLAESYGADKHESITSADGTYAITDVRPGLHYYVCFDASALTSETGYQDQCWQNIPWVRPAAPGEDGTPEPMTFAVEPDSVIDDIDAALTPGGVVTGRVSDSTTGDAVTGIVVEARSASSSVPAIREAVTGDDGQYRIVGLPTGPRIEVCFKSSPTSRSYQPTCWKDTYWNDLNSSPSPNRTTTITASSGSNVSADQALIPAGSITGTVRSAASATPVAGVIVRAYARSGGSHGIPAFTTTSADGSYLLKGLSSAYTYRVQADPGDVVEGSPTGYLVATLEDDVAVRATDSTTGIDLMLPQAAGVRGVVEATDQRGPLRDVVVEANTEDFIPALDFAKPARTAADGSYTIIGLKPSRTWRVRAIGGQAFGGPSMTGYLNQSGEPSVFAAGTFATVNFQLAFGGAIRGTVRGQDGRPLAGSSVVLEDPDGNAVSKPDTYTDAQGNYIIRGLAPTPTGGYTVCFWHPPHDPMDLSTTGYLGNCFRNVGTWWASTIPAGVTPVPVRAGAVTNSIDSTQRLGGAITGTTRINGTIAGNVQVVLFGDGLENGYAGWSDSAGRYRLVGIPPSANVAVCFRVFPATATPQCHANKQWDGASQPTSANRVKVSSGQTVTGIDADLVR